MPGVQFFIKLLLAKVEALCNDVVRLSVCRSHNVHKMQLLKN